VKKFIWGLGVILLAFMIVAAGCAAPAPTPPATTPAATAPAVKTPVTSEQGTLGEVNPQTSTVVVETPQGPETFKVTPNTFLTLEGKTCSLDQLDALQASGADYDCNVVTDADGNVLALNVFKITPPASVEGTITDVNIKESQVTVKTASGDKVFDVDPDTGLLIGGVACSLELVNALVEAGGQIPCTVIYDTDAKGIARYIDMTNPPDLSVGTGTISDVSIEKSTVTIKTDKGERTFEVDAKTGAFLNGEVCSLPDVQAANDLGETLGACQVIFYTNDAGELVYIDISQTGL
jgi:outer membrane protein assembly factor BamB